MFVVSKGVVVPVVPPTGVCSERGWCLLVVPILIALHFHPIVAVVGGAVMVMVLRHCLLSVICCLLPSVICCCLSSVIVIPSAIHPMSSCS